MNNFRAKILFLKLQLLTLVIFSGAASAQSSKELKEIFIQAESHYLYEEYDWANELYLLLETPGNLNIKYKIGTCYLNIPDEKDKAIPYLEAAVRNASYDSKPDSFKEKRAPLDAYFFLAKAYMINNDLEKAISTFQAFSSLAKETEKKGGMVNLEYIDQAIQSCRNAIKFKENPVMVSKKNLGNDFNQGSMNENPAVSFDGKTIVFTERRGLVNVILFSKKIRGEWQTPVEITSQLNAGEDCSTCSLNNNGTELFLYKNDNYDGNIYSSKYINDQWTPIVKLNRNINTKFYESHASVSADGKKLYFTSNREGGQGGLDIYVSEKDASGDWDVPVNLGTTINTLYNEDNPFIIRDDSVLYFCSEGHNSMGGYDNFKSRRVGSVWGTPQNLGFPINSTDDDKFFQPSDNGNNAFYSLKTSYKKKDIFYLGLGGIDVNQIYEITGKFLLNDTLLSSDKNYNIRILNRISGETLYKASPDKSSGSYSINVAPGVFKIFYSGDGYFSRIIDTAIIANNPELVVTLDVTLDRDSSFIKKYDKINLDDIPVVAAIDSSILIKNMNVEDVSENDVAEPEVLYYTVQVMALYNPVDVSYFKYITNIRVMYNDKDKFFRYTTGQFITREEAYALKNELLRKGYPDDIWVKKVLK
jgi:Tol biopolymer transport system component